MIFWLVNDRRMDALADDCTEYIEDRKVFSAGNYRKRVIAPYNGLIYGGPVCGPASILFK